MNWLIFAKKGGNIKSQIKDKIKSSPFFRKLFEQHGIPIDKLDDLKIKIEPIDDAYATADDKEIIIDKELIINYILFIPILKLDL